MNKEELKAKFEKNVDWLKRNVPPDDIYLFSEQTFMAALYFLKKWSEYSNITEEMLRDAVTDKWVTNILALLNCRDMDLDINLDLNLDSIEEE